MKPPLNAPEDQIWDEALEENYQRAEALERRTRANYSDASATLQRAQVNLRRAQLDYDAASLEFVAATRARAYARGVPGVDRP